MLDFLPLCPSVCIKLGISTNWTYYLGCQLLFVVFLIHILFFFVSSFLLPPPLFFTSSLVEFLFPYTLSDVTWIL